MVLRSSRRALRVIYGPRKGVVRHLLPALAPYHAVVGATFELLVVRYRLGVAVMLGVGLDYRRRHDVVLAARYEQERRALLVAEVDVGVLVTRREVPKHGEGGPYLRDRHHPHALGRHRVYGDSCGPVAVVEQDLGERPTEGVAHDDRGAVELAYDAFEMLGYCGDPQGLDGGWVLAQGLDLYLQARICGSQHAVSLVLVALDPLLPAAGGHPESVNQDDGVRSGSLRGAVVSHEDLLSSLFSCPCPVC